MLSAGAPKGIEMLRTDVIRHCHITVWVHRVIKRTSAAAFPGVDGRCTGEGAGAKPSRAVVQDGADVWILVTTVVRFLGGVERGRRSFGNQARPLPAH